MYVDSACMWIASKMEDMTPPRTEDLVYISDYSFSSEKLRSLETRICQELQFRLHRVTPFHFVSVYLRASQAACADVAAHHTDLVLHLTLYLLELSRSCYALSLRKPNLLAAACVYLARATLGLREKPLWQSRPVLFNITPTAGDADAGKRTNLNQNNRSAFWTETLEYYTGYSVEHLTDTILQIHRLHTAAELSSTGVTPAFTKYKTDAHHRVSLKTVVRVEDLGFVTAISHEDLTVNTEHAVLL